MRGTHETTWPEDKPDPKRGRALLIVVVALGLVAGVVALAGIHDDRGDAIFGGIVIVGPDNVYTRGEIQDGSPASCSTKQAADCERKCQDATRPGEVLYASKCEKRFQPTGIERSPGLLTYWCECTWVKAPLTSGR